MAMYKVPVRVYQTPSGKTLWIPTYMRMLSWFVLMPAIACTWVTIEGIFEGSWKNLPILLLLSVGFIAAVVLLRKGAKALAMRAYMKELEQMMLQEAARKAGQEAAAGEAAGEAAQTVEGGDSADN